MPNPFQIGPIAPENNPPIQPTWYSPRVAEISAIAPISQFITQIETTAPNQFVAGQLVRFVIAPRCGSTGLNEQQAYITQILDDETFYVAFNVTGMDSFNPSANTTQPSYFLPIGDVNSGAINTSGRINNILYIEGSFINVSPSVET